MSARAKKLAEELFRQMAACEAALLDDAAPDESEEETRRQETVAEVLKKELGYEDAGLTQLVRAAMPQILPDENPDDFQCEQLIRFLDAQLSHLQR